MNQTLEGLGRVSETECDGYLSGIVMSFICSDLGVKYQMTSKVRTPFLLRQVYLAVVAFDLVATPGGASRVIFGCAAMISVNGLVLLIVCGDGS